MSEGEKERINLGFCVSIGNLFVESDKESID